MISSPDNTVHGGLELPSLTAISHATDEQKNRDTLSRQRKRRSRQKRHKPELPRNVADAAQQEDTADDEDKPQVDYLA